MTNANQDLRIKSLGILIGVFISAVFGSLLIWIVGKLSLGLTVDGIGSAILASVAIAITGGVISWLLGLLNLKLRPGILKAILNILLGAIVLINSEKFISGLTVNGFWGALLASLIIYAISWVISIFPNRLNQTTANAEYSDGANP